MTMKNSTNAAACLKEAAKQVAPYFKTGLKVAGGATVFYFMNTSCKGPEAIQVAKKPVAVVTCNIDNYEIKDAKPGGSKDAAPASLGISINNNGQPNNPETYYYVPSPDEAGALYGKKRLKEATTYEYRATGIRGFGKKDSVNVGIVACNQLLEFLTNAKIVDVSGGNVRLVKYDGKRLYSKEHTGYATQSHYIINRNGNGLAGVWENERDTAQFALWIIPEKKSTYSIKIPFRVTPEGDAAIRWDSNFFAYTSGGRRQAQVAIDEETPVKPAASVRDFVKSTKNTSAFGYSDEQNIVYTPNNAIYVSDTAVKYSTGGDTLSKARGDTAIALGTVDIAKGCKVSDALGKVNRAGLGVIVTRTGAFATYYRLIQSDAKDSVQVFSAARDSTLTEFKQAMAKAKLPALKDADAKGILNLAEGKAMSIYLNGMRYTVKRTGNDLSLHESISVVTLPLTKFAPGLEVLPACNKDNSRQEDFNAVVGEGFGHFSFVTNVPGKKDTMELRILRENDGDVISVKMGMAGVSRIAHTEKAGDIYITLWGEDNLTIVGQVIISKGVPYEMIDLKNNLMKDGAFNSEGTGAGKGFAPMKNKYNEMLYTDARKQNNLRSRFANRSI